MADRNHIILFVIMYVAMFTTVSTCPTKCTCSNQRVKCYGQRLQDIPTDIPADTIHLDLQNNEIETISRNHIKHLSHLQELQVGYNHIEKIEPGTFAGLSNLETLNMESNLLTYLAPGVFDGLGNLTSIYVTNNKLVTVDGAFRNLTRVARMDLGGNVIDKLTDTTFKDMKNLIYLMMPDNNIRKISMNTFNPLQSLSYIVLKNNPIKNSNDLFKRNHRLSYIDLTGCSLREVPTGLPWATRYLQLRNNNITRVKKTAFLGTRYLNIVVLDENQITRIEKGVFSQARDLQEIWLNDNMLKKIPSPFSSKVTKLHISKNRISKLSPKDFPSKSALSSLSLNSNVIATISSGTFAKVKYLKELYLNGNKLASLQSDMFDGLDELETLSLNNNKLTMIKRGALNGLKSLRKLDMAFIVDIKTNVQGNMFSETPNLKFLDLQLSSSIAQQVINSNDMLSSLRNITTINLMNNELKTLNPNLQAYLTNVVTIKIAGNRWHCDKRLQWLSAWLKSHRKLFFMSRNIQCFTPPSLKALPVSLLKPFQFAPVTTTILPSTTTTTTTTTPSSSPTPSSTSTQMTPVTKTEREHKPTKNSKQKPGSSDVRKTRKPIQKARPSVTQSPATRTIMLTGTRIVTVTQRFFVYPSTTPSPKHKFHTTTKEKRRKFKPTTHKMLISTKSSEVKGSKETKSSVNSRVTTVAGAPYTKQMTSGLLTGQPSTPTPDSKTVTTSHQSANQRKTSSVIQNSGFTNTTNGFEFLGSDEKDSKTTNTSNMDLEHSQQATATSSSGVDTTTIIIATCVSAAVLLIILGVIIFFAVRYRQNKLVYHRALQYRQDYSDVVFFVGEPIQDLVDPKPKAVRSRSDRGSTSSRPSEDITNDLDTSMKVYTWDDE